MRAGSAHTSERRRSDGRVIELRGQPLPDGGFVTAFSDVTSHKRTEESLREINETLELRVEERTRQLAAAVSQAELANQSKTRFVMAASHDLLQPLGAARLFNAALRSRAASDSDLRGLAESVDNSLAAAGELLEDLLDISRLDAGGVRAEITEFDVMELLKSLQEQFAPVAAQRGIPLVIAPTSMRVRSDPRLLRRVLQNFIGNASALHACRRRGAGRAAARGRRNGRVAGDRHGPGHSGGKSPRDFRGVPEARSALALGREGIGSRPVDLRAYRHHSRQTTLTLAQKPGAAAPSAFMCRALPVARQWQPSTARCPTRWRPRRSRNAHASCASTTTRRRSRDCANCW